ncbi:MAG: hypothetical protein Q9164_006402, partial [Protoblastenia rupestris]
IQKARTAVQLLEGMDVSVEEQEVMIRELEEEVKRGEGVLRGLVRRARELSGERFIGEDGDQKMSG